VAPVTSSKSGLPPWITLVEHDPYHGSGSRAPDAHSAPGGDAGSRLRARAPRGAEELTAAAAACVVARRIPTRNGVAHYVTVAVDGERYLGDFLRQRQGVRQITCWSRVRNYPYKAPLRLTSDEYAVLRQCFHRVRECLTLRETYDVRDIE